MSRQLSRLASLLGLLALLLAGAPPPAGAAPAPAQKEPLSGKIAYVFRADAAAADSFKALLEGRGYSVTLVPLAAVLATDFADFNLTIIADDTGDLGAWGSPADGAAQLARITAPNRPIIGLGEGGYAFFGRLALFIGWPNGWHGPESRVLRPSPAPGTSHYSAPNPIPLEADGTAKLYAEPVNEVGVYLRPLPLPAGVVPVGLEPPSKDHSSLILEGCRQLWGFSGSPDKMTDAGRDLFVNTVEYGKLFQCAPPQQPDPKCALVKTASPPPGTTVTPGQTILYTLRYTNCKGIPAKLVDSVPADTIFVPGSASDGIAPGADGALIWPIGPGESGTKSFKVFVADTQCNNQRAVVNRARLLLGDGAALESNVVTHPVECPPITLPNDEPPYAEQEVQIHPYPLVVGRASEITVRLVNSSDEPQTVRVSFQTSPERFGIGIPFNTFDQDVVTIPANGSVVVRASFTPASSGHYCIQIKIEDASPRPRYRPIYTQRNLDVTEDLRPGVPDTLPFKVGNPTAAPATINLVVVNTCPGWSATVSPATLPNVGPNGSDIRSAALTVTPPNPVTLGSGCHIDVQGWIGDELIGGIRKLDVPPVHLPPDVSPPWMEPEISFVPSPPVAGRPNQICVELQNPLGVPKTVTVKYAVADFGAGIPFAPVGERTVTLPPNSIDKYCIDWTPAGSGTLHRCVLVTLEQPGYRPMHSQRNVDLRRIAAADLAQLDVPVAVGNPLGTPQPLEFDLRPFGLGAGLTPVIVDPLGDPPPDVLEPGQRLDLRLRLLRRVDLGGARQAGGPATYGDESRVEVAVLLGGEQIGGFTVVIEPPAQLGTRLYLPALAR